MVNPAQLQVGDIISIRHTIESQQVGYYTVSAAPILNGSGTEIDVQYIESDTTPFDPLSQYFVGYVKTGADGADGADGQDGQDGVDGADGDKGFDGNSSKWTYVNWCLESPDY